MGRRVASSFSMMRLIQLALLSSLFLACVPMGGTYGSYTNTAYRSMVVINGVELTSAQEAELEQLLGARVPPGRYFVTASGMMGREGEAASVNLVAVIRERQAQGHVAADDESSGRGTAIHNSSGDSHITSDGNGCTMLSTPSGSLSTGC